MVQKSDTGKIAVTFLKFRGKYSASSVIEVKFSPNCKNK